MNMHQKNSDIVFYIIVTMAITLLAASLWNNSDAPAGKMSEITKLAEYTPDTKKQLSHFLDKYPTPSRGQLAYISTEINKTVLNAEMQYDTDLTSQKTAKVEHLTESAISIAGVQVWFLNYGVFLIVPLLAFSFSWKMRARGSLESGPR